MTLDQQNIHKILVVTLSNLGDAILTLPVFQSLRAKWPEGQIHALAGKNACEALRLSGLADRITPYDRRMSWSARLSFLKGIRSERYDLIIDLRRSWVGLFGGAKRRNRYFFRRRARHKRHAHLAALDAIAAPAAGAPFFGAVPAYAGADGQRPFIVAAVGSKSDVKKWPAAYYAELLDRLTAEHGAGIALVGDPNDREDAAAVRAAMRAPALDLCGRTDLAELIGVLKAASLVITNDSAPLHLADAVGAPTLALFGPTDPGKYRPLGPRSRAVQWPVFCAPCERAQSRFGRECLKELTPAHVFRQASKILTDEFRPERLRVLVIRLDRIGDVVLSFPAVKAIKDRFPDCHLAMMVRPATAALAEAFASVDEVIPYHYEEKGRHAGWLGNLRFIREIRRRKFDVAFVLHPANRAHLVPFWAGIPYRAGIQSGAFSALLTHRIADRRREGAKHEAEYAFDVVRAFGVPAVALEPPTLTVSSATEARALNWLKGPAGAPLVALHVGASCPSKRWPIARFAELAGRIASSARGRIVLIGGKEEAALSDALYKEAPGALNLAGKLTLGDLAAVLEKCRLLVSNDSGPVHVAAAVGTPCVSLFGRNQTGLSAVRWRPLGAGHAVIQKDAGCAVCLAHRCPIGFECLEAITVDEVYEKVKEVLMTNVKAQMTNE